MSSDDVLFMNGVSLRRGDKTIVNNVSWRMRRGEHWAVIGANGSGKTTLLKIAGGALFPTAGNVTVLGSVFGKTDLFALRRRIGWVSSALLSRMPAGETARDIVASGLNATYGLVYELSDGDVAKAMEYLQQLGVADRADAEFGVLSQGEQARVLFARSMMADPKLLILDEACSGLDLPSREAFLRSVAEVMALGKASVIMVTHHIEEIPPEITHALVLRDGEAIACGPVAESLSAEILSKAFGMTVRVERHSGRFWARGRREMP